MQLKRPLLACLALTFAASAFAQAKPEDLIKIRQGSYRVIGYHCGKVKNLLEGQFNKDEVLASATVIQAVVNAGLAPFYAPGTETGTGYHETKVKPEAFDPANARKLAEVSGAFRKEANELVKVAATGDKEAIKVQFGNLTRTCKSCHDDFRKQ